MYPLIFIQGIVFLVKFYKSIKMLPSTLLVFWFKQVFFGICVLLGKANLTLNS